MENLDPIPPPPNTQGLAEGSDFQTPPLDGSLTLAQIYDWQLHHSPNHRLFVFSDSNGGVRNITWKAAMAGIYTGARSLRSRIQGVVAAKHLVPVVAILSTAGISSSSCYRVRLLTCHRRYYLFYDADVRFEGRLHCLPNLSKEFGCCRCSSAWESGG